ncbi:MAG: serine/threonine-protein kinase, partial [Planctomycetota bacterium]
MTPRETRFVKSLVDSGLVSLDEAVQLESTQRRLQSSTGEYRPIWELAVEQSVITAHQSERVRQQTAEAPSAETPAASRPSKSDTQALAPADSGTVPAGGARCLGKYELISKIGQGGMGAVYKARQETMNRVVALKVLPRSLAGNEEFIARFLREARAAGRLSHPNIVAGIDAGFAEGYYYFAMEYVAGQSLGERLAEEERIPETEVALFGSQVAKALDHAHAAGIVHRDVKPENILVTPKGQVKLCDMGLARTRGEDLRVTQAGMAVGTPFYISPEQVRGKTPTAQSDIYSLGCTLFCLVTGRPPYDGDNAMEVMQKHLNADIPRVGDVLEGVSRALEVVILKMMARDPEDRYGTARDAAEDLEKAAGGGVPSALTDAMAERRKATRRGPGTTRRGDSTRNAKVISTRDMGLPAAGKDQRVLERRPRRRGSPGREAPLKLIITLGGLLILVASVVLLVVSIHAREDDREVLEGRTHGDGLLPPPPPRRPEPPARPPRPEPPEKVTTPVTPPPAGEEVKVVLQDGLHA